MLIENITRGIGRILIEAGCYESSVRGSADQLTSLPNARKTLLFLEAAIEEAGQDNRHLAVLTLDVDNFRPLNSRKGYAAGDQVLLLITQVLKDPRRNFEFVARLGDDRFAAVVADVPPAQLESLALELKQAVRAKCELPSLGFDEPILVSVGTAAFPSQATTPEELLLLSYQRAYLEKISRAGITIQLAEGHIGSAHRIAV
jgi:diguanylate cyclase (GGDEF)-like protein